jgi:translation initiation factor RLI1
MIKKIVLAGAISIIISIILISCEKVNKNDDFTYHLESNGYEQKEESNYTTENIEGKASIENVKIKGREISFQIRNLTTDNAIVSAYLEYVRLKNNSIEDAHYPLDCDKLEIPANDVSEMITFNPQKILGKNGVIRIKMLVFENEKDDYTMEEKY